MTERDWILLEAVYLRQQGTWVDMRYAGWERHFAEYRTLLERGYVNYIITGPGDSVYQFTITAAGKEALQSHR